MLTLPGPEGIEGFAFSPDGKMLAASGGDQTVVLYGIP
jgi:WD40 repeat protein